MLLGVGVRGDAGDAHFVDVVETHIEVFGDVVVGATGDIAQLGVSVIDGTA